MTGFQAPNYTQVPNDFFEMARDMDKAELKVVLYIIRETFGYHRETCEVSIRKLALGAGLTPRNAYNGAEKAIARGLIEKTVSPTNITTWRAVVTGDTVVLSQRIRTVSPDKGKVLVKESKEIKRKEPASRPLDILDAILHYEKPAMTIRQAVTDYFKINVNWDTKTARQWMEWAIGAQITSEQIKDAAQMWSVDKRFNWSAPTLIKIFENWKLLQGETGADEIYHAGIIELPAEPMTPEELRFIFGDAPHA